MTKQERKKKKFMKQMRKRDIGKFSEIYSVPKKDIKEAIKTLKSGIAENQILDNWNSYLEKKVKRPEKFIGMLKSWGVIVVDKTTGICYFEDHSKYNEVRKMNHVIYLGESEVKRRFARSGEVFDSKLFDYNCEALKWKGLSELEEHNDCGHVIGEILVTCADEDEPKPNYHTYMINYLSGWAEPEMQFVNINTHKPWPYANRIEKWMHLPEYKVWEK